MDTASKQAISFCDACGETDLAVSMGCASNPNLDMCLTCYECMCQNKEPTLVPVRNDVDITPRNIVKYKSPWYYRDHCKTLPEDLKRELAQHEIMLQQ
jgi:hypothetical protein